MNNVPTSHIEAAFVTAGAPCPSEVALLPELGEQVYRVELPGHGPWMLRLSASTRWRSATHGALAHRLLASSPLGVSGNVLLLDTLPMPGLAHAMPEGKPASQRDPVQGSEALGSALAKIQRLEVPRRGTMATGQGFLPVGATWSAACVRNAQRYGEISRSAGLGLGALTDSLVAAIADAGPEFDIPRPARWVHGSLNQRRIWIHDAGDLSSVVGWDASSWGDAEQDWAGLLFHPELSSIVDGYGRAAFERLCGQAGFLERVSAHGAGLVLRRLASLAHKAPRAVDSYVVAALVARARVVLDPEAVRARLVDGGESGPVAYDRRDAVSRRALSVLARDPRPRNGDAVLCALALCNLAPLAEFEDTRERLLSKADAVLEGLDNGHRPRVLSAVTDHKAWLSEVLPALLPQMTEQPQLFGLRVALAWQASIAFSRLGDATPFHLLHGAAENMAAVGAIEPHLGAIPTDEPPRRTALRQMIHGALVLASVGWIMQVTSGNVDLSVLRRRATDQVRAASESLQLQGFAMSGFDPGVPVTLDALASVDLSGHRQLLPVVLLALAHLEPSVQRIVPAHALVEAFR